MNTLTKENFWNDLSKTYPASVSEFWQWFQSYKVEIHWTKVFNGSPILESLPIEFQKGVLLAFMNRMTQKYPDLMDESEVHLSGELESDLYFLRSFFRELNQTIKTK